MLFHRKSRDSRINFASFIIYLTIISHDKKILFVFSVSHVFAWSYIPEIVRAMNYVISKGWVMYWGTSRWTPVEIMEAYTNCRQFNCVTPIVEQAEYHLFYREKPELYMPELYNKIGNQSTFLFIFNKKFIFNTLTARYELTRSFVIDNWYL